MTRLAELARRATIADVLVLMGALSVGAALLYPTWSARAFRGRVAAAIADVDAVGDAARAARAATGRWPGAAIPGVAPPELSDLASGKGSFSRPTYTLGWMTWEVVDSVEPAASSDPPPAPGDAPRDSVGPRREPIPSTVGAVSVYTTEGDLLAELLDHYGSQASFVLDTMWLLVLPERSDAPSPP